MRLDYHRDVASSESARVLCFLGAPPSLLGGAFACRCGRMRARVTPLHLHSRDALAMPAPAPLKRPASKSAGYSISFATTSWRRPVASKSLSATARSPEGRTFISWLANNFREMQCKHPSPASHDELGKPAAHPEQSRGGRASARPSSTTIFRPGPTRRRPNGLGGDVCATDGVYPDRIIVNTATRALLHRRLLGNRLDGLRRLPING